MTEDIRLAGLALIELTARQIVDPEQAQLHRDESQVILRAVDPTMVALEVPWFWPVWSPALASRSAVDRGQAGAAARLPDRTEATAAVLRLRKTRTVQSVAIDPRSPSDAHQAADRCRGHRDAAVDERHRGRARHLPR